MSVVNSPSDRVMKALAWAGFAAAAALWFYLLAGQKIFTAAMAAATPLLAWLRAVWSQSEDMSHGPLLPLVSLYALYTRRRAIRQAMDQPDGRGVLLTAVGLLLFWAGLQMEDVRLGVLALTLWTWTIPFALWGAGVARQLVFPCGYLLLSIPIDSLVIYFTMRLRLLAAALAVALVNGLGLETVRIGTGIHSMVGGGLNLDVAEPCSGLRSIFAMTALAGAYAFLYLSHPVMCSFLIMFLVMKVLLTRSSSLVRRLYFLTVLLLSAAVGVWAWPFFPAAQAVLSSPKYGDLQFAGHWTLLYENALWKTFPAWVGYFYFAYRLCRKNFCFITISAFFALLIYLLNFLIFRNTVLSRFIVFIAFFGHIGMVLTLKHLERHKLYFHSLITFLVLLLLFGHRHLARYGKQVGLTWDILRKEPVLSHSNIAIYRELSTLDPYISASTVVLAPMYVSWYLPGVLGCRVVASEHSDPFMTDFFERKDVVLKFFETDIPDAKRLNILSAYKVTHVLIPASYQYRLANFSKFLAPMLDTPTYKLYFVRQ